MKNSSHARVGRKHRIRFDLQNRDRSCRRLPAISVIKCNRVAPCMHAYIHNLPNAPRPEIPPTLELFSKETLVERHPNLLTNPRVQWALRNRSRNGLLSVVYESKSGQLLVHEPEFLRWYLGFTGRSKPRASRVLLRRTRPRSLEES